LTTLEDNGSRGWIAKRAGNGGRGRRENEKFSHLCLVPSDQDPVASVVVFIVSTGGLIFIGYGTSK